MSLPAPVAMVKFPELLEAFEFVSSGTPLEHSAFINPDTGVIYYLSSEFEFDEEVPDDLKTSDKYIAVPHKNNLDLGRDLALSFADDAIPSEYETVAAFFRKKGAYAHFKGFLEAHRLLERWYTFEARETEKALRAWCNENSIALTDESSAD
jgi:hypothetical protein